MTDLRERKKLVEENVRKLEDMEVDQEDFYEYQGIKHTIQEAVEACIDIASHIIAIEGFGTQEDYADYFKELENREVIDQGLSESLEEMARFRNFLIHRYPDVEAEEIQEIIDHHLDDLLDFIKSVERYESKNEEEKSWKNKKGA